jgi:hypothetical protein
MSAVPQLCYISCLAGYVCVHEWRINLRAALTGAGWGATQASSDFGPPEPFGRPNPSGIPRYLKGSPGVRCVRAHLMHGLLVPFLALLQFFPALASGAEGRVFESRRARLGTACKLADFWTVCAGEVWPIGDLVGQNAPPEKPRRPTFRRIGHGHSVAPQMFRLPARWNLASVFDPIAHSGCSCDRP